MAAALPEMAFFDAREQELVRLVCAAVGADQAAALARSVDWLGRIAQLVVECPTLTARDAGNVIDHLATVADYEFELHEPTRAVLGQAYLLAKINFFKSLEALVPGVPALAARARFELGQSVYSRLAEELFIAIVTDPTTERAVKERAGAFLQHIWDHRLLHEIDDFAPQLEAAWEARNKVRPVLGTMLGSHELCRLFQEARDERFLDYFGDDDISDEQREAFEEFLFGLAHEEIAHLRAYLAEHGQAVVAPEEAARILEREPSAHDEGPEALYASYKRRKSKANYRALAGAHGPKHTAEEFVMIELLRRAQ